VTEEQAFPVAVQTFFDNGFLKELQDWMGAGTLGNYQEETS
jgi:hypothetical protein